MLYTLPSGRAFLPCLAVGLQQLWGEALPQGLVLLPNQRACQGLRQAFMGLVGAGDGAVWLPRIQPLAMADEEGLWLSGDPELDATLLELPPAITPMRRRMLLLQLVLKQRGDRLSVGEALKLADALAQFLDSALIEGCDLAALATLAPAAEHAAHWQQILEFLGILSTAWPALLAAEGCIDAVERQNRLQRARLAHWQRHPPAFPVVAAGSRGSQPLTAQLLASIASLPRGMVVLAGLDSHMEAESWQLLAPTHPQFLLARLLEKMGVAREAVQPWVTETKAGTLPPRAVFLSEAMRPAPCTDQWHHAKPLFADSTPWQGLTLLTAPHEQDQAMAAALILRHALATPGHTAALITPDRAIAARVSACLQRWGVAVDDSAGQPLLHTALGHFFSLVLPLAAPTLLPSALMAFLQHPLVSLGFGRAGCLQIARTLEKHFFRAAVRHRGLKRWLADLRGLAGQAREDLSQAVLLLERLDGLLAVLLAGAETQPLSAWLEKHVAFAGQVAESPELLWRGVAGEALAAWLEATSLAGADYACGFSDYAVIMRESLRQQKIRPPYGSHPRLAILGLLEARLLHFDTVILAGLNEGVWPDAVAEDPWMSPAMRRSFGLPDAETRIGVMAHDFVEFACQKQVYLLRSERQGETPTIPSRWLLRLQAVLDSIGVADALASPQPWFALVKQLDRAAVLASCAAPAVAVPLAALPRRFSASDLGDWLADPYAFYARRVLQLHALGGLDAAWGGRERGMVLHRALDAVVRAYPTAWPEAAEQVFLAALVQGCQDYGCDADALAAMTPRLQRLAAHYWAFERQHRATRVGVYTECKGEMRLNIPLESGEMLGLNIHARADRIDRFTDNSLGISDYKTGSIPSGQALANALNPQLWVEALILHQQGFAGIAPGAVAEIRYIKIGEGAELVAAKTPTAITADSLLAIHQTGLEQFLTAFFAPTARFHAAPRPQLLDPKPDYTRLARLAEWSKGALSQEEVEG